MTFLEGVQRSSNVAFATLAMDKIGEDTFREYITKFGLDKKTGIDLPNEITGKIQYKYQIEKVTTAFGQGSTITPIQQIQGASAIANDGKMMRPYVIKSISNPGYRESIEINKTKSCRGTNFSGSSETSSRLFRNGHYGVNMEQVQNMR